MRCFAACRVDVDVDVDLGFGSDAVPGVASAWATGGVSTVSSCYGR
jgi:hypothetical protein